MEHYHDVIGFLGYFVVIFLFMRICSAIGKKLKNRAAKKRAMIDKEMPSIPIWGNAIVESRETGKRLPVCIDTTGMWYLGGEETEPFRLSNREWFIVDKR